VCRRYPIIYLSELRVVGPAGAAFERVRSGSTLHVECRTICWQLARPALQLGRRASKVRGCGKEVCSRCAAAQASAGGSRAARSWQHVGWVAEGVWWRAWGVALPQELCSICFGFGHPRGRPGRHRACRALATSWAAAALQSAATHTWVACCPSVVIFAGRKRGGSIGTGWSWSYCRCACAAPLGGIGNRRTAYPNQAPRSSTPLSDRTAQSRRARQLDYSHTNKLQRVGLVGCFGIGDRLAMQGALPARGWLRTEQLGSI
jgi:hypothetical protein